MSSQREKFLPESRIFEKPRNAADQAMASSLKEIVFKLLNCWGDLDFHNTRSEISFMVMAIGFHLLEVNYAEVFEKLKWQQEGR